MTKDTDGLPVEAEDNGPAQPEMQGSGTEAGSARLVANEYVRRLTDVCDRLGLYVMYIRPGTGHGFLVSLAENNDPMRTIWHVESYDPAGWLERRMKALD